MKTVRDILRDADPLRDEPQRVEGDRDRLRQALVAAASDVATPSSPWFRTPAALLAAVAVIVVGMAAVGSWTWSAGGPALHAAIRFEVRLAEDHPEAGLREARVAGSARVVYLHEEVIVGNGDIAESRVVEGDGPSRFGVAVELTAEGAEKMREATAGHVGRPVAILVDGEVVAAPMLRGPISTSAVISGDYTEAEAGRIVDGIRIR